MAPGSAAEGEAVSGAQLIAQSLKAQVRAREAGEQARSFPTATEQRQFRRLRGRAGPGQAAGARGPGEQPVCTARLTPGAAVALPLDPALREGGCAAAAAAR